MFIRAHLPIPSDCDQQSDIRIQGYFPENASIAPGDARQRTICWEENMKENHEFWVEYSYIHTARYHDLENAVARPGIYDFDLEEQAPHIVFTPYIRSLVKELTEGVTDPLEKARIFYDFITKNMSYTFMPSYFLLENIPDTCAQNFDGDCGVFALLFLALCLGLVKLEQVKEVGGFLTSILPILFVAPTVGIAEHWALISDQLLPIALLLLASMVLTFGLAGKITAWLMKKGGQDHE
jgi:putative effector of murein hydrolase LrgA (UPF0299 family)